MFLILTVVNPECRNTLTFVMLPFVMLTFLTFKNKPTLVLQSGNEPSHLFFFNRYKSSTLDTSFVKHFKMTTTDKLNVQNAS
jgi:hypothetical protein